jgi:class 3 adenylate cyclase
MASSAGMLAELQALSLNSAYYVGTDEGLDDLDESEAGDEFDAGAISRGDDDDDWMETDDDTDYDSDYSGSDLSDESSYLGTEKSGSMFSADFSENDEYADLMASMPIALGREGGPTLPALARPPPQAPLPIVPFADEPLEGLAMLQSIRGELEKVGRMIVAKKDGEGFLVRAHILASINMLATQVPSCVLEHLGHEIQQSLDFDADFSKPKPVESLVTSCIHLVDLDYLGASDISGMDMDDDCSFSSNEDLCEYQGNIPLARTASIRNVSSAASAASFETPPPRPRLVKKASISRRGSMSPMVKQASITRRNSMSSSGTLPTMPLSRRSSLVPWSPAVIMNSRQGSVNSVSKTVTQSPAMQTTTRNAGRTLSGISFDSSAYADPAAIGTIPSVSYFECALLFVDISGFTKLSTILDPESLSKVINSYFQAICDKVDEFDGDIQKFAGDALFAAWQPSDTMTLHQCVEAAAACATTMVRDCSDFPVMAFGSSVDAGNEGEQGSMITTLNIHCGLGVGAMAGIHVGDSTFRREYLYLGDAINQATEACGNAFLGEVTVSNQFDGVLSGSDALDGKLNLNDKMGLVIANRGVSRINEAWLQKKCTSRVRNAKSRGITRHVDGLQVDALIEYRRLISLYCHPVVVSNDVAASNDFKKSKKQGGCAKDRHREEAELRSVYVMFINPIFPVEMTGDSGADFEVIDGLNSIMRLVTRELNRFNGHLRQMIVDDKGLVLIATFGLRGSTFPSMVSERALPATVVIHNALKTELEVDNKIGGTFGDAYCGAVGGLHRHEYAVMGPTVNLAARLMCSSDNPGILVDNAVRKMACKSYGFNALDPVIAKGYKDPVPIFEPLSPLERTWGKIHPNFAGRKEEIKTILNIAREMARRNDAPPKLVMLASSSGMGKTALVAHAIEHTRKMMSGSSQQFLIAKHVSKTTEAMVPYSSIGALFHKVLANFGQDRQAPEEDEHSAISGEDYSASDESLTSYSVGSSAALSASKMDELFLDLCCELDAPLTFADHAKRLLLGTGLRGDVQENGKSKKRQPSLRSTVSFIAHILRTCLEGKRLTIFAIDDIHQMDEFSWQVLEELFYTASNLLIIGTTYTMASGILRVNDIFWEDLNEEYLDEGRFIKMELGLLSKEDILTMTMKALGLQRKQVTPELLNEVYIQSGGMAHFANEILDGIKHRSTSKKICPEMAAQQSDSLNEIILHRIDTLDISVRNLLNVGAILGVSFRLRDLLEVIRDGDSKEDDLRKQTLESLQTAIVEGIIHRVEKNDSSGVVAKVESGNDDELFAFHFDVWRKTLLGLMLDSRKRNVNKKIAQFMEDRMKKESVSVEFRKKICGHWKAAGDTTKATNTTLSIGLTLEDELGLPGDSIAMYEEMMELWGWDKDDEESIAGFSVQVLELVGVADLSNIVSLMVAYARAHGLIYKHIEMVASYENALRIFLAARVSDEVKDRSIVFPAFVGLSTAIADGHLEQDRSCRYEQAMLRRFLEETRNHDSLIHHIHALYLQFQLHAKMAELDKALAVHSLIRKLYNPDEHTKGLCRFYGMDSGALSFSMGSYLHLLLGGNKVALRLCRTALKEIVPKIESSFQQAFCMLYPLTLVLMGTGYGAEGRSFFEKVVIQQYGHPEGSGFYLTAIYKPFMMLLDLTGKSKVKKEKLAEYLAWAIKGEGCRVGDVVNIHLGRLGRCGDSISAEIYTLLAASVSEGKLRDTLLTLGKALADEALKFNKKHRLKIAQDQVRMVLNKLNILGCK